MLGDEIRKAREEAGMSQEKLSFEAGVDRSYLSELENNHRSPTVEMLLRLCDAMDVRASELLARVERQRRKKS